MQGVPQAAQEEAVEEVKKSEEEKAVEGEERKEEVSVSVTTTEKENGVNVGSSAWFAGWTSYVAGEVRGGEETKKVEECVELGTTKADEELNPTPSELEKKKEGAVVRAQDQPAAEPSSPPPSKSSLLNENPLSSTMSTTAQHSIWSSTFTSTYTKTISETDAVKAIEDGRTIDNVESDKRDAEIMDIE